MGPDQLLAERIFEPLGMVDSGFWVALEKKDRVAQPGGGERGQFVDPTVKRRFLSGGGGAVSTASDYARFVQMLLSGGELDGTRLLSPKTVEYMASDHLGPVPGTPEPWGGWAGTTFWVDPTEELIAVGMSQEPATSFYFQTLVRNLAYQSIID